MSFEEEFPSLEYELLDNDECFQYNSEVLFILKSEVEKHCLDKQRVREKLECFTLRKGETGKLAEELNRMGIKKEDATIDDMSNAMKNVMMKELGL